MAERLVVLAIVLGGIIAMDLGRLRQAARREKVAWGVMMALCLYLGADLLLDGRLPQARELVELLFRAPVEAVDRWFKSEA